MTEARAARVVPLDQWGKVVVEELLFRAAKSVSQTGPQTGPVTIDLPVTIEADAAGRMLVLRCPDALDGVIELHVDLKS